MAKKSEVGRRSLLKNVVMGGAAMATATAVPETSRAQTAKPVSPDAPRVPAAVSLASESTPRPSGRTYSSCGGDYMVDVMRAYGIEYMAATPGNTFMGLHEAVVNHGMLANPKLDWITTLHEETSVAMAHGYAKIEGKPMACAMHTAVGLQHAAMAIYNAWCDRVPIFMITGAFIDERDRRSPIDWYHSAVDVADCVRDFTKWDATPGSLEGWGESAARGLKFAMTPPYGPILLTTDTRMQERPYPGDRAPPIPKLPKLVMPAAEDGALEETAKMLVAAENPVLFAGRCARTPQGLKSMIELAELLQAPVCDGRQRMNFPWRHPLNHSDSLRELLENADVVLELEPENPYALPIPPERRGQVRRLMINSVDLFMKSNFQDFQRYPSGIDVAMAADAEASLPALIEAVKRNLKKTSSRQQRGAHFARAHMAELEASKATAALGWNDSPISVPRMCQELYALIKDEDWSFVSPALFQSHWPQRLWAADKHYQYLGPQGGGGIGYGAPSSLGAALANRKYGRLSVSIVGDGDFMFVGPGSLWTAAHDQIPILYLVHNNRCYHAEIMQMQAIANRRERGLDRVHIGNAIANPNIDYAAMAKSVGVYGEGPIENPADLGPALKRALAVVKKGEPALVDVVSQGR